MPSIVSSIHDATALRATCKQWKTSAPYYGCIQIDAQEAIGWVIRLRGVNSPIVCDTLTGLVTYHPHDNAFLPYRRIMRFIHGYYAIRHRLLRHGISRLRRAAA